LGSLIIEAPGGSAARRHGTAHLPEQPDAPVDRPRFESSGVIVVLFLTQNLAAVAPWFAAVLATFTAYVGVTLAVTLFHRDAKVRRHAATVLDQLLRSLLFRRPR
jgi:hypothetical protein